MNILTEGRQALVARLETITQANGYRTNAGHSVKSGWLNEALKEEQTPFPCIVVQPARGTTPERGPNALKLGKGFSVTGAVSVGVEYESALEDLELDILKCLIPEVGRFPRWLPLGITNIQIGAPDAFPPGEGVAAAAILIPVHLSTIVEGVRS